MLYTIDEWSDRSCFTSLMNREKRDASKPLMNGEEQILFTIDKLRETECFTPLMNGEIRDALHH